MPSRPDPEPMEIASATSRYRKLLSDTEHDFDTWRDKCFGEFNCVAKKKRQKTCSLQGRSRVFPKVDLLALMLDLY